MTAYLDQLARQRDEAQRLLRDAETELAELRPLRRQLHDAEARIAAARTCAEAHVADGNHWNADAVSIGEDIIAALDEPTSTPTLAALPRQDAACTKDHPAYDSATRLRVSTGQCTRCGLLIQDDQGQWRAVAVIA
ncbi:hypothetical protein [Streptomyces sp. CB03911]|uniref:hypothetical protein n=1 Tax=Streptomyces sp. CB03911 TaxID=1804758 RepID=UPI00093D647B|nr:hypothetical protein [Streptomyces sp. CB03911]OKI22217.1 hypothetical protein A6A07_34650 [Streptomyces sp. CB03911]